MDIFLLFSAIVFLLAFNGLFVAAEFAAVSVKKPRLAQLVDSGNTFARQILAIADDPHKLDIFVSTCQLGITVTSLALGSYAQARVIALLTPVLQRWAPNAEATASAIATALVLLVLTVLQVILAELAPKNVSIRHPEQTALITFPPLLWMQAFFRPLIALLNGSGTLILRLIGSPALAEHSHVHSSDEIVILLEQSNSSSQLDEEERDLLVNTLELHKLTARKVMIPRNRMLAANADETVEFLLQMLAQSNYSRIPLYEGSIERVIGMVHLKDLLLACHRQNQNQQNGSNEPCRGREIIHPVEEVPASLSLDKVMARMQANRRHLAIVVDEYGGTAGMITFEDLIEEIIGEFRDEFDKGEIPHWEIRNRDELWMRGDLQLDELNDLIDSEFSTDEADTLGGLLNTVLGHVPEAGERVEVQGHFLRVERLDGNAILLVSLLLTPIQVAHIHGQPPPSGTPTVEPIKPERNEQRQIQSSEKRVPA